MDIKALVNNLNTTQKVFAVGLCALPFLWDFFDSLPGLDNSAETSLYIACWVICGVGIFLFKDKTGDKEDH